jgi:hypothetical protein
MQYCALAKLTGYSYPGLCITSAVESYQQRRFAMTMIQSRQLRFKLGPATPQIRYAGQSPEDLPDWRLNAVWAESPV